MMTTSRSHVKPRTPVHRVRRGSSNAGQLRIREFAVGFGDAHLITIPGAPTRAILVDAGFHSAGKGAFSGNELAAQVIADVEEAVGKKRVDVVIATHRHQDHISTFNSAAWDELEIGEVWMPWVEDLSNKTAQKLWKKQRSFACALAQALPSFGSLDSAARQGIAFALSNAGLSDGELAAVAGWPAAEPEFAAWSNANALDRLHHGFARRDVARPRFLPAGDSFPETFETPVLPGVRVHVLGPPRKPELMSKGNPEADGESYRALALRAAEASGGDIACALPFGPQWLIDDEVADPRPALTTSERAALHDIARDVDPLFAAQALDDMINATSLVLVLQIGAARLVLPGDAEWGTWKRILDDPEATALLKGTTFLKVGHHGSHNATPKRLVESVLGPRVKAMISTQEGPDKFRHDIPLPALLDALHEHGIDYARSDRPDEASKPFVAASDDRWIDLAIPF